MALAQLIETSSYVAIGLIALALVLVVILRRASK
jgi:hypothetical protein